MTFTKEQLIASAHSRIEFAEMMLADNPEPLKERTWSIELELARIALAALESRANAEPVGFRWRWVDAGEGPGEWWYHGTQHFDVVSRDKNRECQLIYTRPQPAPVVVPDDLLSAMEEVLRISDRDHDAWHKAKAGIVSCRAAMLNGGKS